MKTIIILLFVSFTLTAQQVNPSLTGVNTTLSDSFAVLGENVKDLFIDPEIEGRLIATTGSDEPKIKISTNNGNSWTPAILNIDFSQYVKTYYISFNSYNLNSGFIGGGVDLLISNDRGESWDSTKTFPEWYYPISYVVHHPLDSNTVFVSNSVPWLYETLLYKSNDGGNTWVVSDSSYYREMVFHPTNPNIIYGIKEYWFIRKSTNGGETWETINNNLVYSDNNVRVLEIDNNNPNILYCGLWYDYDHPENWRLAITTNGGESWERIDSTLLEIDPEGSVYDILLDPNKEGRFYVSYTGGLYLTEDNGKHYQKIYSGEAGRIWSDNKTPATIYFNSDKGLLRTVDTFVVGIKNDKPVIPLNFVLYQNYPNPFNPTTTIKYSIATSSPLAKGRTEEGFVTLKVYDVLGREVATLVNEKQSPGSYSVMFNASGIPSGIYFYKLTAGKFSQTKKMLLLK